MKRLLGLVIFGLVGSVGFIFSENLAFAQDDTTDNVGAEATISEVSSDDLSLINSLVNAWNSAIAAIEAAVDSLQSQVNENKDAIADLQSKVGTSELSASSGSLSSVTQYTNTASGIIPSNSPGLVTAVCDNGDVAVGGSHETMYPDITFITVYPSESEAVDAWDVPVFNTHPTDDIQIDVTVTCVTISPEEFTKADSSVGLG